MDENKMARLAEVQITEQFLSETHPTTAASVINDDTVDEAVAQVQSLPAGAFESANALVNQLGISIKMATFGKSDDNYKDCLGFCDFDDDNNPVIVLRDNLPDDEQAFALFHEIGHVLMHKQMLLEEHSLGRVSMARRGVENDVFSIDLEASAFARRLLVNRSQLVELASKGQTAEQLAGHFCLPVDHLRKAAEDFRVKLTA